MAREYSYTPSDSQFLSLGASVGGGVDFSQSIISISSIVNHFSLAQCLVVIGATSDEVCIRSMANMKVFWHLAALLPLASPSLAVPIDGAATLATRQTNPLNPFLALLTSFGPGSALVNGVAGGLTGLEGLIAPLSGGSTNATDIATNKPCAAMTLVFARGTTEPGNMGVVIGPQLVTAIKKAMPGTSLNAQGVEYAASVQGYLQGGGADGTASM